MVAPWRTNVSLNGTLIAPLERDGETVSQDCATNHENGSVILYKISRLSKRKRNPLLGTIMTFENVKNRPETTESQRILAHLASAGFQ